MSRVVQAGNRLGFDTKAGQIQKVGTAPGEDHFQGDDTLRLKSAGLKNNRHPAAPEFSQNLVPWDREAISPMREA